MHNERVRLFAVVASNLGVGIMLTGVISPFLAPNHIAHFPEVGGWLVAGIQLVMLGQIWLGLWE